MNWFERYAIPGTFFMTLMFIFNCILFPDILSCTKIKILTPLITIAIAASLPVGYILSIISQWLSYASWWPWNVVKRVDKKKQKELGCPYIKYYEHKENKKTWKIEAIMAFNSIAGIREKGDIERGKWMHQWYSKRFDVYLSLLNLTGTLAYAG